MAVSRLTSLTTRRASSPWRAPVNSAAFTSCRRSGAADVEETYAVGFGQKTRRRLIHVVKRLDLAPREVIRDQVVLEGLLSSALKIVSTRLAEALRARCASGVSGGARNAGASASARVRLRAGPSASCWCQSRNS